MTDEPIAPSPDQVLILTPEDQIAHDQHCRALVESLAPSGAMETDIAQSIADDRWRLKHAVAMEAAIFALGIESARPFTGHPEIDAACAHAATWLKEGKNIALLSLYEGRIQRRVEKNLAISQGESYDIERDFPRESWNIPLVGWPAWNIPLVGWPAWNIPLVGWPALPSQFVFSLTQIARLAAISRRLAEAKKQLRAPPKSLRQAA